MSDLAFSSERKNRTHLSRIRPLSRSSLPPSYSSVVQYCFIRVLFSGIAVEVAAAKAVVINSTSMYYSTYSTGTNSYRRCFSRPRPGLATVYLATNTLKVRNNILLVLYYCSQLVLKIFILRTTVVLSYRERKM